MKAVNYFDYFNQTLLHSNLQLVNIWFLIWINDLYHQEDTPSKLYPKVLSMQLLLLHHSENLSFRYIVHWIKINDNWAKCTFFVKHSQKVFNHKSRHSLMFFINEEYLRLGYHCFSINLLYFCFNTSMGSLSKFQWHRTYKLPIHLQIFQYNISNATSLRCRPSSYS